MHLRIKAISYYSQVHCKHKNSEQANSADLKSTIGSSSHVNILVDKAVVHLNDLYQLFVINTSSG